MSAATLMSVLLIFLSSFILSVYVFGCLSLFLFPLMLQCNTLVGNLLTASRFTCPNHLNLTL